MIPGSNTDIRYKVGEKVRLRFWTHLAGTVMEVHGKPPPGGGLLYRIYIPMDPEPLIVEAREEEIEPA
jgi:hypothetical protein